MLNPSEPLYGNPGYTVGHALRRGGLGALNMTYGTVKAGYSEDALRDDRAGELVVYDSASTRWEIDAHHASVVTHPEINRAIFSRPYQTRAGTGGSGSWLLFASHNMGLFTLVAVTDSDGLHYPHRNSDRLVDFYTDRATPSDAAYKRYVCPQYFGAMGDVGCSELTLGTTLKPGSGVAHTWTDVREPTLTDVQTRAGMAYGSVDGEPRRVFRIDHRWLTGADLALYDYVLRECQYGALPIWFDPPTAGGARELLNGMDDSSDPALSSTGGTLSDIGGAFAGEGAATRCTAAGATPCWLRVDVGDRDFTDCMLSFEYECGWVPTQASELKLILYDTEGGFLSFDCAAQQVSAGVVLWFFREFVDPAVDPGATPTSATPPADLRHIAEVSFFFSATSPGQWINIDGVRLHPRDAEPVRCNIVGYSRDQDGPVPQSIGLRHRVQLQLEELST